MAFCVQCGAQVDAKFCQACGAVNPQFAGAGSAAGQAIPPPSSAQSTGLPENLASALCYALGLITGIIFLVIPSHNRNPRVRFHAFQSIFFHAGLIAFWTVMGFAARILRGFAILLWPIYPIVAIGGFCLWLYLMYRAYNNQKLVLPIIGPLAEQQAHNSSI